MKPVFWSSFLFEYNKNDALSELEGINVVNIIRKKTKNMWVL